MGVFYEEKRLFHIYLRALSLALLLKEHSSFKIYELYTMSLTKTETQGFIGDVFNREQAPESSLTVWGGVTITRIR